MNKNKAWNDYWRRKSGKTDGGQRCLPCANDIIAGALEKWWHDFANTLERKGRILDLATGNGIVLQHILEKQPALKAVGIDAAEELPKAKGKYKLRGGISMEDMPYPDASFDAITSQFGVEYGDLEAIGREVARLLKPHGQCAFIMHRKDGPIVQHNLPRLTSLAWACREEKLPEKAYNWVQQRALLGNAIPGTFQEAPKIAAEKFGARSAGHEFATALVQSLMVGQRLPPQESHDMVSQLEAMAENEMGRIESLISAALEREELDRFATGLRTSGLAIKYCDPFESYIEGADFAWLLTAQK